MNCVRGNFTDSPRNSIRVNFLNNGTVQERNFFKRRTVPHITYLHSFVFAFSTIRQLKGTRLHSVYDSVERDTYCLIM